MLAESTDRRGRQVLIQFLVKLLRSIIVSFEEQGNEGGVLCLFALASLT